MQKTWGIIFLVFCIFSCEKTKKKLYEISDGQVVGCRSEKIMPCGLILRDCDDGVDILCALDVRTFDE
jgi:hypothetical protein